MKKLMIVSLLCVSAFVQADRNAPKAKSEPVFTEAELQLLGIPSLIEINKCLDSIPQTEEEYKRHAQIGQQLIMLGVHFYTTKTEINIHEQNINDTSISAAEKKKIEQHISTLTDDIKNIRTKAANTALIMGHKIFLKMQATFIDKTRKALLLTGDDTTLQGKTIAEQNKEVQALMMQGRLQGQQD